MIGYDVIIVINPGLVVKSNNGVSIDFINDVALLFLLI